MRKILIIDDFKNRWEEKVKPYLDLIDLSANPNDYFEYDEAGNECRPKFDPTFYEYVFIHHSQSGDSLIPSNLIDLIKGHLGLQLVLFSGNIEQQYENKERENFYFRSLKRRVMQDNISFFISESIKDGDCWDLKIFYYDYIKRLIGEIVLLQDEGLNNEELFASKPMIKVLRNKGINNSSKTFYKLYNMFGSDLINELRAL